MSTLEQETVTPPVEINENDPHKFYSSTVNRGLQQRNQSKIIYLRNFNNWIKSTIINEYLRKIRKNQSRSNSNVSVFDMGCGKGGDIAKWHVGNVQSVTFADLTENAIEDCKQRVRDRQCYFQSEYFTLDATKEFIGDKLSDKEKRFDLVSSQFVLHYSFGDIQSANQFLRNAAEFLRPGGYFIGTTMNSCRIVELCRKSTDQSMSNDVFTIRFDASINLHGKNDDTIPLFGAKYHFTLDEVVNCPEYLVYFPVLIELAKNHGLELVENCTFTHYFRRNSHSEEGKSLLAKMSALEYFRLPVENVGDHSQYQHAINYITKRKEELQKEVNCCRTLSKQEWEMGSLYIVFAFQKKHDVTYPERQFPNP